MTVLVSLLTAVASLAIYRQVPARPGVLLLAFVIALLFTMSMGITLGLIAPDQKTAELIGAPVMMFFLMPTIMPWKLLTPKIWDAQVCLPTRPLFELFEAGFAGGESPFLRNAAIMLPYILLMLWICTTRMRRWASAR